MSDIAYNPELADVLEDGYATAQVSVGITQVEAKTGASRLVGRESLYIENKGTTTIYYGPSGVTTSTGAVLYKKQFVVISAGESLPVFMISDLAGGTVIVQELA